MWLIEDYLLDKSKVFLGFYTMPKIKKKKKRRDRDRGRENMSCLKIETTKKTNNKNKRARHLD